MDNIKGCRHLRKEENFNGDVSLGLSNVFLVYLGDIPWSIAWLGSIIAVYSYIYYCNDAMPARLYWQLACSTESWDFQCKHV